MLIIIIIIAYNIQLVKQNSFTTGPLTFSVIHIVHVCIVWRIYFGVQTEYCRKVSVRTSNVNAGGVVYLRRVMMQIRAQVLCFFSEASRQGLIIGDMSRNLARVYR